MFGLEINKIIIIIIIIRTTGADPGFQVRGVALKNVFGVFRVKNHDFTPKNQIFSIAEGGAKIFEEFRVKNHDFTPKNHIFSNFRGARAGCAPPPPPLNPPLDYMSPLETNQSHT